MFIKMFYSKNVYTSNYIANIDTPISKYHHLHTSLCISINHRKYCSKFCMNHDFRRFDQIQRILLCMYLHSNPTSCMLCVQNLEM